MPADPDAVQVLAAQLHAAECLPSAAPFFRFSARYRRVYELRARRILTGLADAGWHLTTTKEF